MAVNLKTLFQDFKAKIAEKLNALDDKIGNITTGAISADADNSIVKGTDDLPYFKERTPEEIASDYEGLDNTNKYTDSDKQTILDFANMVVESDQFTSDMPIVLSNGKTVGRFGNGDIIPSAGKTPIEVFKMIAQEPLAPTVQLTSPTTIKFNQTAIANVLNFSYVINSLNSQVATAKLEWRRGNSGSWTELTSANVATFTHSLTDSDFNTAEFNYRYTVVDDKGGTKTETLDIAPQAYQSPTLSGFSVGDQSRDRGDIETDISGTISRNSDLVDVQNYQLQYKVDNGSWTDLGAVQNLSATGGAINETHNDNALVNSDSISYRAQITDDYTTTTKNVETVNFLYRNFLGYEADATPDLAKILALENGILSNQKERTVNGVTAAAGQYTIYAYNASDGDLNSAILDGAAPVLGAFTKISDISGTNSFGATVTYRVYVSNATQAFSGNSLKFS